MIKEIAESIYFDKAQNGARQLFDFYDYRLLDGTKGEEESYFILEFHADRVNYYEIDLKTCYDLLTLYHNGDRDYLMALLTEMCN